VKRARIVIRDLAKTFHDDGREVAAVQDVAFEVFDQEFVAIVGPPDAASPRSST
jgi:ABC-type glutathione transport system ATPase component